MVHQRRGFRIDDPAFVHCIPHRYLMSIVRRTLDAVNRGAGSARLTTRPMKKRPQRTGHTLLMPEGSWAVQSIARAQLTLD